MIDIQPQKRPKSEAILKEIASLKDQCAPKEKQKEDARSFGFQQFVEKIAKKNNYPQCCRVIFMHGNKAVYVLKNKNEKYEKPNEQDNFVRIVRYENEKELQALVNEHSMSNKWNHPNIIKFKNI